MSPSEAEYHISPKKRPKYSELCLSQRRALYEFRKAAIKESGFNSLRAPSHTPKCAQVRKQHSPELRRLRQVRAHGVRSPAAVRARSHRAKPPPRLLEVVEVAHLQSSLIDDLIHPLEAHLRHHARGEDERRVPQPRSRRARRPVVHDPLLILLGEDLSALPQEPIAVDGARRPFGAAK